MSLKAMNNGETESYIYDLAERYYRLHEQKRQIEESLKTIKSTFSSLFKTEAIKELEVKKYKIMLIDVISKRFDVSKVKRENPKLYHAYLTESRYEKLTITLKEVNK